MRANPSLCVATVFRSFAALLIALSITACKTEKDPDPATIIGTPPSIAYLGVEYSYNFGAYGGEATLDYGLTNAPPWLALEDTSNKARQGIIMRGVPGLTGGGRGEADLGMRSDINLITTDGRLSGLQPFDILVRYNPLSLDVPTLVEGESPSLPETEREHCAAPDLETPGQHTFTFNEYNDDGSVSGTKTVTAPTHPIFVTVLLDQPSVTRVDVAFELTSAFDGNRCDDSLTPPHQKCEHGVANNGDAIIGQDLVALGSNSGDRLQELSYLDYQMDEEGVYSKGVITFEPGITECYIRLEAIDDDFPEPSEVARLTLTEVRSGLAGLGDNNDGVNINVALADNEPLLTMTTVAGGSRDVMNVGLKREYIARLSSAPETEFRAKLGQPDESSAWLSDDFEVQQDIGGGWVDVDELSFPAGEDEIRFRIDVPEVGYENEALDDLVILLGLDGDYQAGREFYPRSASKTLLRVSLNELTVPLTLNPGQDFVPTDLAIAHSGRSFVVGYDSNDNDRVRVKIYDQKGALEQDIAVSAAGDQLETPAPVITAGTRKVSDGVNKVDLFEFVVAYSTSSNVAGTSALGGFDVLTSRYGFDQDSNEYARDWTLRTGTAGDDIVRSVNIEPANGFIVIAGETNGAWPGQNQIGGFDSFLQRIDTLKDGPALDPQVAWTRQVGSAANDSVAGASLVSRTPILFGSARGSVQGQPVLGGIDAFYYSVPGGQDELTVNQVGTDADEPVTAGLYADNQIWLLGNSANEYSLASGGGGSPVLDSSPLDSQAGFLQGFSISGIPRRAFSLNDEADLSTETFQTLTLFDGDLVVAGSSEGDFSGSAGGSGQTRGVLARVSLEPAATEDDDGVFRNDWREQLDAGSSDIRALANYRDDELVALLSRGQDWMLLIFSPEGELLTPLP